MIQVPHPGLPFGQVLRIKKYDVLLTLRTDKQSIKQSNNLLLQDSSLREREREREQVTLVCRLAQLFLVEGLFLDVRFLILFCVYMFISNVDYILSHRRQQIFVPNIR